MTSSSAGGDGGRRRRSKLPSMPSSLAPGRNNDSQYNVDYFSHPWDEMDLKASWSVITKRKHSHTDGVRLENASWRKWMQQRFNLRKVNPELLRWKKDEDITWLYGPFCRTNFTEDLLFMENDDGQLVDIRSPSPQVVEAALNRPNGVDGENIVHSSQSSQNKKSSLKMRSIIGDLKKFQQESDVIFERKQVSLYMAGSQDRRALLQSRKVKHSKSESEIHKLDDSVFICQKPPSNRMTRLCINQKEPVFTAATNTSTTSELVRSQSNSSNRLRFSNEVEVLEYDQQDWKAAQDALSQKKARDQGSKVIDNTSQQTEVAEETLMDSKNKLRSTSASSSSTSDTNNSRQQQEIGSGWFQTVLDVTTGFLSGKFFR